MSEIVQQQPELKIPQNTWLAVKQHVDEIGEYIRQLAIYAELKDLPPSIAEETTPQITRISLVEAGKAVHKLILDIRKQVDNCRALKEFSWHDAHNDMHVIAGCLEIGGISKTSPEAFVGKYLQYIEMHYWTLMQFVESMQFYTEGGIVPTKTTDLSTFFSKSQARLKCTAKAKHCELEINVERGLFAKMNEGTIAMLIINCINNAGEHGNATVINIDAYREGDKVIISIMDNGRGIPEEVVDRIFELGFTTKTKATHHHGLGLANARERMAAMGGSIICEPHGGMKGGAKFQIILQPKQL